MNNCFSLQGETNKEIKPKKKWQIEEHPRHIYTALLINLIADSTSSISTFSTKQLASHSCLYLDTAFPPFKLYPQNNFFKFLTENRARASVRSEENARKFSQPRGKRSVQICTTQNWINSNSQLTKHIQVASSAWTHRPYIVECYLIFINLYTYTHTWTLTNLH